MRTRERKKGDAKGRGAGIEGKHPQNLAVATSRYVLVNTGVLDTAFTDFASVLRSFSCHRVDIRGSLLVLVLLKRSAILKKEKQKKKKEDPFLKKFISLE